MENLLNIISIIAATVSVAMVTYMYLKGRDKEDRDFIKAKGTELDDKRIQLEEDLYRANERLIESSVGFNIYQNIYK